MPRQADERCPDLHEQPDDQHTHPIVMGYLVQGGLQGFGLFLPTQPCSATFVTSPPSSRRRVSRASVFRRLTGRNTAAAVGLASGPPGKTTIRGPVFGGAVSEGKCVPICFVSLWTVDSGWPPL
jgi:hypothetical protein